MLLCNLYVNKEIMLKKLVWTISVLCLALLFYVGCAIRKENTSQGYIMNKAVKNGEAIYIPVTGEYIYKKDTK